MFLCFFFSPVNVLVSAHFVYCPVLKHSELRETPKLHLRPCGSVSACLGAPARHLGAVLSNSPLLGKCTPPSANLILPHPVDWNGKRIKANTLLVETFQFVPEILWSATRRNTHRHRFAKGTKVPYQYAPNLVTITSDPAVSNIWRNFLRQPHKDVKVFWCFGN